MFDHAMIALSAILFILLTAVLIFEKDKFSALAFFSYLFYGYVLSGIYFASPENLNFAKFFNFHGQFQTDNLRVALLCVIVGYVFFVSGVKFAFFVKFKTHDVCESRFIDSRLVKNLLITLFICSAAYWLFVAFYLAGGPIQLLSKMGIYLLLLEQAFISTAPYLVAYSSASILFLIYINKDQKIPVYLFAFIAIAFLMYLSTSRLAGAVFFLFSFLLMYIIEKKINARIGHILIFGIFLLLLAFVYVYRYLSNLEYLDQSINQNVVEFVGQHFFGNTNFGDLQSIVFSWQYASDFGFLHGVTFLDAFLIFLSNLGLFDTHEISIGARLRDAYFYHVETGAPAPGVLSEFIMNFGVYGITIGMFFLGFIIRVVELKIATNPNITGTFIRTQYLLFVMLLAKVDSTHMSSLIWTIMPFYILYYMVLIACRLLSAGKFKGNFAV